MRARERAKIIEEAIRLTWDSLQSHLKYTHVKSSEGRAFHKKCVKEYHRLIRLLIDLY